MKHTIIITDEDGAKSTIIYQHLTAVAWAERRIIWTRTDIENRCEFEFATEDEARAAYDEINEGLEAWHARNDPTVVLPLRSNDLGDFRYEVLTDGFAAHGEVYKAGDIIEYDPAVSPSRWRQWMAATALIKQVPRGVT